ncbi:hypothetical protein ANO14919_131780 [Xylariales sp. No.14919]|nr:hypothetical protein ANO14919_131780 [Xylariales sp. No.14919]
MKHISDWLKDHLPGDLKGKFSFSKKEALTITAIMPRDTITPTLHQAKSKPSRAIQLPESRHKAPGIKGKRAEAPMLKSWKLSLSTGDKIAIGGLAAAIVSAGYELTPWLLIFDNVED